jgi:hypothetical protein
MTNPVAAASQAQPVAQPADARPQARAPDPYAVPTDTVQLSSAAQAALQEARETPTQTAKNAGTGDLQTKRSLAKETAEKAPEAPPAETPHSTHVVA